ncbi:MAG: ABC transporter ATP-binding protein [Clostridiales bacterium]|nr:ABC transporter ATP-binding protein [Clostridiales bacterium]
MSFKSIDILKEKKKDGTFKEIFRDWKWIFSYTRNYKFRAFLYTVLGILSSTCALISSVAGKFLVDVVVGRQTEKLPLAAAVVAGGVLVSVLISNSMSRIQVKLNCDMTNRIRGDVFDRVLSSRWMELNNMNVGDIMNRFHEDIDTVAQNATSWIPTLMISLYSFIATFFVIWHYSPVMSLIALMSAPVLFLMSRFLISKQKEYTEKMRRSVSGIYTMESETLYNIDTVKSFGTGDAFSERHGMLQEDYKIIALARNMFQIKTGILMSVLSLIIMFAAYGYCLYLLWGGLITYGTMVLFLQQRNNLSGAFKSVVGMVPSFVNGSVSAGRVRELMDLPSEAESGDGVSLKGEVTVKMEDVSFSYKDGRSVLSSFTMEALPGKITAVEGPSGKGKTTIFRLLLGLVTPSSGSLSYICEKGTFTPAPSLRGSISYVPQGNSLISGTVAENMRLAKTDATEEEMRDALICAQAWDFLPEGTDTVLGEKGKGISEGQAQRVAIARALLRDAPVILMDEATSALDGETERRVMENILKRCPGKTFIVSTHRASVLSLCDKVYKL